MRVGIILTNDSRSKAYIQKLIKNNITLDSYILMNNNIKENFSEEIIKNAQKFGFDVSKQVKHILLEKNIHFKEFNFVDINHPELIDYLKNDICDYFIFTGGGILKKEILNLPTKFIHIHPGIVPNYRGSTCFYYSIINEKNAGVTAFIMDENLDTGKIIYQKKFDKPDHKFIDEIFDPHIRSEVLIDIFCKNLLEKEEFKEQDSKTGETYFIIHPVLKHIAILSCIRTND